MVTETSFVVELVAVEPVDSYDRWSTTSRDYWSTSVRSTER